MAFSAETDRFFGSDSKVIAEIVNRRHPLAFAVYATVMFIGLIFVLHLYAPGHSEQQLFPGVSAWARYSWRWMMVVGGLGALITLSLRPRTDGHWPDIADLLHLEGIFAILAAFGLTVYLVVLIDLNGSQSVPAASVYGTLIVGHIWRGSQALRHAHRLEKLAMIYPTEIPEER